MTANRMTTVVVAGILAISCVPTWATTIQEIVNNGGSITIGQFTFSDFCVQGTAIGGNSPSADLIDIAFSLADDGSVTLDFHGGWQAGPMGWAFATANIGYKVTVAEGFAADTGSLSAVSSTLLGDSYYLLNCGIFDGDPSDPTPQLLAELLLQEGLGQDVTGNTQSFGALQEFYVNAALFLGSGVEGGMVVFSEFSQTFGGVIITTPEPASLSLLTLGGMALLVRRRR